MAVKTEIKVEADLTKSAENITNSVIIPPTSEASKGITKLLSVVTTFIDNATYKYIANSEYKKKLFLDELEKNIIKFQMMT